MGEAPPFEVDGQVVRNPGSWQFQKYADYGPAMTAYNAGQFILSDDAKLLCFAAFFLLALAIVTRK